MCLQIHFGQHFVERLSFFIALCVIIDISRLFVKCVQLSVAGDVWLFVLHGAHLLLPRDVRQLLHCLAGERQKLVEEVREGGEGVDEARVGEHVG